MDESLKPDTTSKPEASDFSEPAGEQKGEAKDLLLEASKTLQEAQRGRTRLPLTRVFTTSIVTVIALFILVTLLAYWRLLDFKLILEDITEKSVPSIAVSGQTYNQVNALIYLTESLTKTTNLPSSRIATQSIEVQLQKLRELASAESADPYLQTQMEALSLELDELGSLIQQKLNNEIVFREKLNTLYHLYDVIRDSTDLDRVVNTSGTHNHWYLTLAEVVTMAGETVSLNRIHEIRFLASNIREKLTYLQQQIALLPPQQQQRMQGLPERLRIMILEDKGLLPLRIEQLRITGRSIGRGNFVKNLILDYARLAEYQSYQLSENVVFEAQQTSTQVNQQIRFIGLASTVAILFLIAIVYFIQYKVISRLKTLNEMVKEQLQGSESTVKITGNDEISDIAQTFDIFSKAVVEQNQLLHSLSLSDGLTGIANRRAFDERLVQEIHLAKKHSWAVSVLLLDVDWFKNFNDHYGHAEGDRCLQKIAQTLKNTMLQETDFVARYGGEEFVCILPDTHESGAANIANTLLDAVRSLEIPHEKSDTSDRITISIGIRTFHFSPTNSSNQMTLLEQADKALYKAKHSGKDRYELFIP